MKISILDKDIELFKSSVKLKGENRYYVYIHYRQDINKPFYIGRGCGYRCVDVRSRNKLWKQIFGMYSAYCVIVQSNLTLKESARIEIEYIKEIGKNNLVNLSDGGEEGASGVNNYFYGKKLVGELNGNYNNKYAKNPLSIAVLRLDLNGNILKEYGSSSETKIDGYIPQNVNECCLYRRKLHKGNQFIYKSSYKAGSHIYRRGLTHALPITCYDMLGNFVKSYSSINEVSKDGFSPKCVQRVVKGNRMTHKNMIFKTT